MTGDLFINGKDAYATWGVNMGNGFLDALDAPLPMKEYIENSSRAEHGKQVITANARVDSREVTLEFTIAGTSEQDYRAKKNAFCAELQEGALALRVPALGTQSFRLVYTGKSAGYGLSLDRCFGRISAKFTEPDPTDRE